MIQGSGNYMVDAEDNEPRRDLECGCRDYCRCDDADEGDL